MLRRATVANAIDTHTLAIFPGRQPWWAPMPKRWPRPWSPPTLPTLAVKFASSKVLYDRIPPPATVKGTGLVGGFALYVPNRDLILSSLVTMSPCPRPEPCCGARSHPARPPLHACAQFSPPRPQRLTRDAPRRPYSRLAGLLPQSSANCNPTCSPTDTPNALLPLESLCTIQSRVGRVRDPRSH